MIGRRGVVAVLLVLLSGVLVLTLACAAPAPTPTQKPAPTPAQKPAPAPAQSAWPRTARMTIPPLGGALAVYGSTVAGIIERNTKVIVTPQPTGGTTEAVQLFAKGEAEMSTASALDNQSIYVGRENYLKVPDRVRGFSGAYSSAAHFVVRADSNIKTFADLKGKRLMFVRPGQLPFLDAYTSIFKAYGISEKDVTLAPALGFRESAQALKENTADAVLQYSAAPTPEFAELDRSVPIRLLSIDADKRPQILKDIPYQYIATIKGGTYGGTPNDVSVLFINMWINMARTLPDDFAYAAAKAVVTSFADLQGAHAMFKAWQPKDLAANPVVPFHPGVLKYYKEAGLIAPETEQKHNDLLKLMDQKS